MHRSSDEEGFTLLELLVVIIIISILSAIAIPTFLVQRRKSWDAASKNDLRNLAGFQEIYYSDFGVYGTIAEIQAAEPKLNISKDVTLTVVSYDTSLGYCLSATHEGSPTTWYYDSQGGGMLPKGASGCPVTAGVPGDSATG